MNASNPIVIEKVLNVLNEMKIASDEHRVVHVKAILDKYKTDAGTPTYAVRLGFFTRMGMGLFKCNIKKFEPWHAKQIIEFRKKLHPDHKVKNDPIKKDDLIKIANRGFQTQIPNDKMQEILSYLNNNGYSYVIEKNETYRNQS